MIFDGTLIECAEVIAQLDTALGYPRQHTEDEVTYSHPGVRIPMHLMRTETVALVLPAEVDERGEPVGEERAVYLPPLRPEHRERVGRARVLRLLNRGSKEALVAVPGIGATRADAIIARRATGRMVSIEDLRAALPAAVVQALRDYALTKIGDEDADETGVAAKAVQK